MRAEAFLRNYRVLEELLESKYARSNRTASSVVMEFLRDEDSLPFRDQLNLCREVRNLLTHNADADGSPVVEPSQGVLEALLEVVEAVKQPLTALSFATPAREMMTARLGYQALRVMRQMQERGFSHVPVLEGERIWGVFSVSTVFSYLADHPDAPIGDATRVKLFRAYLPVDRHMTERFLFVNQDSTYLDLKRVFERDGKSRKRVAAVFVTGDGGPDSALLGMITPWDMLGKVQNGRTLIEGK